MKDIQKHINYWLDSAERNSKTAKTLLNTKHYDACLFFCHLTLEKLLKGAVVAKTKKASPYIHNLMTLAERAKIELSDEQLMDLKIISTFNIAGRYDDAKLSFYKMCTPVYTKKYFEKTKSLYLCIKKEHIKKFRKQ
ncbi:MAG: HEPN domain-containing protein [Candidatus Kerfeldbacteria bacterium]|nr:HEPN domain-containing protein [Candidatus Kerfeldbacteria bacterium]